ncbi:MAG: cytochrome P450 [Hyphomonas sp.]|nr:cytochrome P450 [Hyphomonas sp.]
MAADTFSFANHPALQRPKVTPREPMHPGYTPTFGEVPPASSLNLETLDVVDPEMWRQGKFWDRLERLRKEDPVHYTPDSFVGPYWSVTLYEDIMAVDTDHKRFSSSWEYGGITLGGSVPDFEMPMFIALDEPRHSEQRKTVQPAVAPNMLKEYEPLIRERTRKVLDSLPVNEPFDWVDRVSIELTGMMLATLFDYPQERRRELTHWSDIVTNMHNPDICPGGEEQWKRELMQCLMVFMGIFQEKQNKEQGLDLMSLLAHGEKTKNMSPMELLGNVVLLIVGGNDTSRNTMSASVYALNKYPDQYAKLKEDPSLIPNMVSETIRWQTPLSFMRRTALEDVTIRGKTIKKGEQVAMWYVSGNRDESFWDQDPYAYIIDRKNARQHLSFGFGIHRCVGNRLAELQLKILWEELMDRYEHIEVLAEPSFTSGAFVRGYTWMPVVLHPK